MTLVSETERRRAVIKKFLKSRSDAACSARDIVDATGVPKRLIDFQGSLSSDPEILREKRVDPDTGRRRAYWRYVGLNYRLEERPVVFTPWKPWGGRGSLRFPKGSEQAGVYLLARFDKSAKGRGKAPSIDDLPEQVIYVGMSKNLNNRPLAGHRNGTERYKEMFGDSRYRNLYVSQCPICTVGTDDGGIWYRFLEYLEMKVQWEFTRQHRRPPAMHFKKKRGWVARAR